MTTTDLKRTLGGSLVALVLIGAFLTFVRSPQANEPLDVVPYTVSIVAVMGLGVMALVGGTMRKTHRVGLVRRSELLEPEPGERGFLEDVRGMLQELPDALRAALDRGVSVVIVDGGDAPDAYARYGRSRLTIFRNALVRDFADRDELREQMLLAVRYELAHHLDARELGAHDFDLR